MASQLPATPPTRAGAAGERRLVLFDIDHTLVDVQRFHEAAYEAVVRKHAGVAVRLRDIQFAGKTTPNIFRELYALAGLPEGAVEPALPALLADFRTAVVEQLGESLAGDLLPGVPDLLRCLAARGHLLGVVTGNPPEIGRTVLERAGLLPWFQVFAFGTEAPQRPALVGIAAGRAQALTGEAFPPERVVVVGDTPYDVDAGKRFGARTVAVGTGLYTRDELAAAGPDLILASFADHAAACAALAGL
jgi:phosphoglycolate phosphatase-like HAD superfamily hydrolase